ncbi:MAG: helix-turn-helix transcriptional regulator [Chitinophagaceae bacterium]
MTREELLKGKEYWINQIQNDLYSVMEEYMAKKKINRTQLAEELNVSKGYISQILKGDFDHKVSKLVELALSSGKMPVLNFIDSDEYISNDRAGKVYDVIPLYRPGFVSFKPAGSINCYYRSYVDSIDNSDKMGPNTFVDMPSHTNTLI